MTRAMRSQLERDLAIALTYACAVDAHDTMFGGGFPPLDRGTRWEPRSVDGRRELLDMHSRLLLFRLRGRTERLEVLLTECRRRASRAPVRLLTRMVPRRRGERSGRTRPPRRVYEIAATLAADARDIVIGAGAADDPVARTRLLTAMRYQATRDVLERFLGDPSLAGPPDRFIADLDWLDTHIPPSGGRA
jgi:hypothetical protein